MIVLGIIGKILLVLLKILLVLLLVLLVLLLAVLLLPLSYEATGRADGKKGLEGVDVRAAVKYAFGLLAFRLKFSGGDLSYSLKLAGRKTLKRGGRRKQEEENLEEDFPEPEEPAEKAMSAEDAVPETRQQIPPEEAAGMDVPGDAGREDASKEPLPEAKLPEPEKSRKKEKKAKQAKMPEPKAPEPEGEALFDRLDALNEKREVLWDKFLSLWDQLQDPVNRKTASRVIRAVRTVLRRVLPHVVKGKVLMGTGDPASTGQILGVFYALYPLYGDKWELTLTGEFEEKIIRGRAYMAGRFRLMGILVPVLRLLGDRNIRKLLIKWWKNR